MLTNSLIDDFTKKIENIVQSQTKSWIQINQKQTWGNATLWTLNTLYLMEEDVKTSTFVRKWHWHLIEDVNLSGAI